MNFFEHQAAARRNSSRLVLLFVLAVAGIVLAVDAAAWLVFAGKGASVGETATMLVFTSVLTLAIIGGIRPLAEATALLLLGAFVIVNTALVVLKFRPDEPRGSFEVPWIVPALAALVCLSLIGFRLYRAVNYVEPLDWHAPLIAIGIGVFIGMLYLIQRPKNVTEEALAHVEHPEE